MTAIGTLLRRPSTVPAVAAAVTLLSARRPASACDRLEPALQAVAPHLSAAERAAWATALAGPLGKAGMTTPRRAAAFLGQCAVESGGFRCLEEDLNYSATRLCQVWPSRFPDTATAKSCAMQPETLANRIYAGRMGNGDQASGDGWRFRGRGLMQITGRDNYQHFAQAVKLTLDDAVEHAATPAGAADSAIWFWSANHLAALADSWSLDAITRKINGGLDSAAERSRLCSAALHVIGA